MPDPQNNSGAPDSPDPGLETAAGVGDATRPQILIPVSAEDHARARARVRYRNLLIAVAAVLATAWIYKYYTDPLHAQEALDSGQRLLKSGQYSQAILSFDQAISYRADFPEAFQGRGRAHIALARPNDAVPDFRRYTELRPRDPVGYVDLSRTYAMLEDYASALDAANRAVENGPDLGASYQVRGVALRRLGRLPEALEDFNKAVALAPEMANFYERGATHQALGQHERAIEDFTEVIRFDVLNAQAFHARALSYRALGRTAQANADHRQGRILDGR